MNATKIEWTDFSANPIKYRDQSGKVVWGCIKKSPGCAHCYSEAIAERFNRGGPFTAKTMGGLTPFLDEKELKQMLTHKPAAGKRCFVGDMTDVFGEWVPDEILDQLFAVFALRHDVTWQVLTKRADRMRDYFAGEWIKAFPRIVEAALLIEGRPRLSATTPLENVWLGISCEDQQRAGERIPLLLQTPAAVRFLSCEPLLGPVDLTNISAAPDQSPDCLDVLNGYALSSHPAVRIPKLDWVIVGAESGHGARPFEMRWARSLIAQCRAAGVACFTKQLGRHPIPEDADDSSRLAEFLPGWDANGGDMDQWPADLRVRQFPERSAP